MVAVLSILESLSIGRAFGRKFGYEVDNSQEFFALGVANMLGSLFMAYPVTGSFSRTAVNASSGAKTLMSGLISAVVVIVAIELFTASFKYIPLACLAAIVIGAVSPLIDVSAPVHIWKVNRVDVLPYFTCLVLFLMFGVE